MHMRMYIKCVHIMYICTHTPVATSINAFTLGLSSSSPTRKPRWLDSWSLCAWDGEGGRRAGGGVEGEWKRAKVCSQGGVGGVISEPL
jgi:hypothetical protein